MSYRCLRKYYNFCKELHMDTHKSREAIHHRRALLSRAQSQASGRYRIVHGVDLFTRGDELRPSWLLQMRPLLGDEGGDILNVENPFAGIAAQHLAAQTELDGAPLHWRAGGIVIRVPLQPHR